MRKRFLIYLLMCMVLVSNCVIAYAEPENTEATEESVENKPEDESESSGEASSAFKSALATFLGHEPTENELYDWSFMITTLQADGLSANGIAGVLGNIKVEGGSGGIFAIESFYGTKTTDGKTYHQFEAGNTYDFGDQQPKPYTYDSGKTIAGEGHGIVQWTQGRCDNLIKFTDSNSYSYVTVKHQLKWKDDANWRSHTCKIPNMTGQVAFMLTESEYAKVKPSLVSASSPESAAEKFCNDYEKPGTNTIGERQKAAVEALPAVEACTGLVGTPSSSSGTSDDLQNLGNNMVAAGLWTESDLARYSSLIEKPLNFKTREQLNEEQLKGIIDWKNNIKYSKVDKNVNHLRVITIWIGIAFLVYIVLLYLAFWFDKINNFIELNFLLILSGGNLMVSPEEHECTFPKRASGTTEMGFSVHVIHVQPRTVNHKTMVGICIIGLIFGVSVITGDIFIWINWIVDVIKYEVGIFF